MMKNWLTQINPPGPGNGYAGGNPSIGTVEL